MQLGAEIYEASTEDLLSAQATVADRAARWRTRQVVRQTPGSSGADADETPLDIPMFEVGAHDVWMSALPLKEGFVGRLPVVMSATGAKYWAVPRVVGTEKIDLGDGVGRKAWVVELDWWGMGAANDGRHYPGATSRRVPRAIRRWTRTRGCSCGSAAARFVSQHVRQRVD